MAEAELQERTCRCCGRPYKYPVPKNPATRFYCDACTGLNDGVRATFEQFNKRLKKLSREVKRLEDRLAEAGRS